MRMIQVGVGAWGASWASVVSSSANWELVAVTDPDGEQLRRVGEKVELGERGRFESLAAACREVEADAALIVAPPPLHGPLAREALEAGLHCLVEKPLSPSIDEARGLVKRAEEEGRALMASQNYRFSRGYRTVQAQVQSGALGRVEAIRIDFRRTPLFHGFRLEMDEPLLLDMAVHHLDQVRGLLSGRPIEVRAHSHNPSWSVFAGNASALVEVLTDDGAVVSYSGTWAGRGPETTWNGDWFLQGSEGALSWSGEEVRLFPRVAEAQGRIARRLGRPAGRRVQLVPLAETERAGVLAEFAAAIRERREPETSGRDNLLTLELVFAATQAAAAGRPIRL